MVALVNRGHSSQNNGSKEAFRTADLGFRGPLLIISVTEEEPEIAWQRYFAHGILTAGAADIPA